MMHALFDGIRRVGKAPAIVLGVYVITLLTAAPLGIVMHGVIATDLGNSVAADDAAVGVNWEWWEEFQSQATGIARTFSPRILGFAAVLHNQSNLVDNQLPRGEVLLAVVAYLGIWMFLVGGIIDRLARQRRIASVGFFATCGTFFFRFLVVWACSRASPTGLCLGRFTPGCSKISMISRLRTSPSNAPPFSFESRCTRPSPSCCCRSTSCSTTRRCGPSSKTGAAWSVPLLAAIRFIRRRPHATLGLYLLNGGLFFAVLAAYAVSRTEPGRRRSVDVGRLRRWASVRGRETVHETGVLRIPDRVFPESAGPLGVRRHTDCRMARLSPRLKRSAPSRRGARLTIRPLPR